MKTPLLSWIAATGIAAFALAAPISASAKPLPPLHGFCIDATPGSCVDVGASTPTSVNPPVFGFTSGGQSITGDFIVGILIPNDNLPPASFTILNNATSLAIGTATPLSITTSWTNPPTNELGAYMTSVGAEDITGGNGHPLSAYLTSTQNPLLDPSATGFWVYEADLGTRTLQTNANALNGLIMTLDSQLPLGSWLLGFLCTDTQCTMNANSGGIIEEGPGCPDCHVENIPEPLTLSLFGAGLIGAAAARRLRRKAKAA